MGDWLSKNRAFSLYDIEEFLKEAGAEKINERAIVSLEKELENTVKEIVNEAQVYANYAGRTKLIKGSDVRLANDMGKTKGKVAPIAAYRKKLQAKRGITLQFVQETPML